MAGHPNGAMATLLVAIQIGFAGLFVFYSQTMLGTVWQLGQWTIFLALAALIARGAVERRQIASASVAAITGSPSATPTAA
jgi:hypothetical protein